MKRRTLMQSAGGTLGLLGVGLPLLARSQGSGMGRFAPFKGQTVTVSLPTHPHYDAMLNLLPEFTKQTGIKVEVDRLPMPKMKEKQLAELSKPQGSFDLVCYVVMWKGEYVKKNLVRELAPFLANAALADPNFDLKDIIPAYLENLGLVGGWKGYLAGDKAKLYGLPYGAETSILAYRRDIFAKHKLQPPTSYYEMQYLLPLLKEKEGIGSLSSRAQAGHQCVHAWLLHLNPMGGKIFESDWMPRFNDQAGVRALKFLKQVIDTGPQGNANFDLADMTNAFLQGQTAMYLDSTVIFGAVRDPKRSKIDGKVAYVRHPKAIKFASQSGGFGLAIPRNAKNAEAGFLLMQWLTSKAQDKAVCQLGGAPARLSTIDDVDLIRQYPEYSILRNQILDADPDWRPIIAEWDEINTQALGVAVSEALTGKKSAEDALNGMVPKVTDIMKRGGYLKT